MFDKDLKQHFIHQEKFTVAMEYKAKSDIEDSVRWNQTAA